MLGHVRKWGRLSTLSVLDQGLFSGGNFLISVLLARWTSPESYGAFAVAFSIYLCLAGLVCSLTIEPMMVYGATDYRDSLGPYLRKVLLMHVALSVLLALPFLLLAPWAVRGAHGTFLAAGMALPCMLLVWFVRRVFYLRSQSEKAVVASAVHAVLLVAGLVFLKWTDAVDMTYAYLVFMAAGAGAFGYYLTATPPSAAAAADSGWTPVLRRHWKFGRWLVPASLASSAATLFYAPMLGALSSLQEAAAYKAVQNLALPFQQFLASLSLLLLPVMAGAARTDTPERFRSRTRMLAVLFGLAGVIYGGIATVFGTPLLRLLYASSFYLDYDWLIPAFALTLILAAFSQGLAIAIRAGENTLTILVAKVLAAAAVVLLATTVPSLGLKGIVICMLVSAGLELAVLAYGAPGRAKKEMQA